MLVRFVPGINIRFRCGATIRHLQSPQVVQLPASGRTMQSLGTASSQQNHFNRNRIHGPYLQVISAAARIETQRIQVKYAQATYDRANTQLSAGTNTRVDLTRSLVQLQSEQERSLALEGDYQQQKSPSRVWWGFLRMRNRFYRTVVFHRPSTRRRGDCIAVCKRAPLGPPLSRGADARHRADDCSRSFGETSFHLIQWPLRRHGAAIRSISWRIRSLRNARHSRLRWRED